MAVANQRIITINKPHYTKNFLTIGKDEWENAFKLIDNLSSFALYLYLMGNADGYKLELSQKAVSNALGISRSTYYRAVNKLVELGYIYDNYGHLNFAPSPQEGTPKMQNWDPEYSSTKQPCSKYDKASDHFGNKNVPSTNGEINNKFYKEEKKKNKSHPSESDKKKCDAIRKQMEEMQNEKVVRIAKPKRERKPIDFSLIIEDEDNKEN